MSGMTAERTPVQVGRGPLSFDDVVAVARHDAPVVLTQDSIDEIARSRTVIEGLASDTVPHYGVSTGFGALATRHIPTELRAQLQRSLVRSHAAGSGPEVEREVVRALMLLRLSTLEKEGLALINGTDGMLGMLVLAITDLRALLKVADISAAMSVEGLLGTDNVFAADLHELRPHPGQGDSAYNLRTVLADSPIRESHRTEACTRVQDAYSLRCAPQVAGGARDTVDHATLVATRELAAAVDNPVVTLDGRVESNGNFHGAPVAYVLDFLAIVAADVASMSERRTDRFLDKARSHGLNPFLADDPGVDSGHMIAQYTQAAIVSEMKRLAAPASVDSIPSSAMQEDHVSMGWSAARKLRRSVDALTRVLAIEVLTAARGIELRAPLEPSPATGAVVRALREAGWQGPGIDRFLAPDIETARTLVADGTVVRVVEEVTGPLR